MSKNDNSLPTFIDRLHITLNDEVLLSGGMIKSFVTFLTEFSRKKGHNIGFVMHLGTPEFDALLISYFVIYLFEKQSLTVDKLIDSLNIGDMVVYDNSRFRYQGKTILDMIEYVELKKEAKSGDSETRKVPKNLWKLIKPYEGSATSEDGRGIRTNRKSNIRKAFLKDILEIQEDYQTLIINTSITLLMNKQLADYYISNISFIANGQTLKLNDLINISYFTESNEFPYPNNVGKTEANLKITDNVLVLDNLVHEKGGNKLLGVGIIGENQYSRAFSVLESYYNKDNLDFVMTSDLLVNCDPIKIKNIRPKPKVFAVTPSYLKSRNFGEYQLKGNDRRKGSLNEKLVKYLGGLLVINRQLETVSSTITSDMYSEFNYKLRRIKYSQLDNINLNKFVINAYSIMKFCNDTLVPIEFIEKLIERGIIRVESFEKRFEELHELANNNFYGYENDVKRIIEIIEEKLSSVRDTSQKGTIFFHIFKNNQNFNSENTDVILDKAYYVLALKEYIKEYNIKYMSNVNFFSKNQYKSGMKAKPRNCIIFTSPFLDDIHNNFKCMNTYHHITIIYKHELDKYNYIKRKYLEWKRSINDLIGLTQDMTIEMQEEPNDEKEIFEELLLDRIVNEFYKKPIDFNDYRGTSSAYQSTIETELFVLFDNNTQGFFTKYFTAYVLKKQSNGELKVVEKSISFLESGDKIVFNKRNDKRLDVIDEMLENFVKKSEDKNLKQAYTNSKVWREKLNNYRETNNYTKAELSRNLILHGASVQIETILRWLDDSVNMVGPSSELDLKSIGRLINDEDLIKNSRKYYNSFKVVRKNRKIIMKELAIYLNNVVAKKDNSYLPESIRENASDIVEVLTIEYIEKAKHVVPTRLTNRPLIK